MLLAAVLCFCGQGAGVELIFSRFKARHVDAFDLDPRCASYTGC